MNRESSTLILTYEIHIEMNIVYITLLFFVLLFTKQRTLSKNNTSSLFRTISQLIYVGAMLMIKIHTCSCNGV
jgi:hypothetical protein